MDDRRLWRAYIKLGAAVIAIVLFLTAAAGAVVNLFSFAGKEAWDLTFCDLSNAEKRGLAVVSKYSKATSLDVSYTNISDISFAGNMKNLKTMYVAVSRVPIDDWSFLPECEQLERFTGVDTGFEDLSLLSENVNLKKINLFDGNRVKNIDDVTAFKNLTELYISSGDLYDITPLENMTELECLYVSSCNIDNVEPLGNCKKLKKLSLRGNENLTNISPIANLENLEEIFLYGTAVSDFEPLLGLPNLQRVVISEKSMDEEQLALFAEKGIAVDEVK